MKEIYEKREEIETFEKPENSVETKVNKKTNSHTYRGVINGYIHKVSNMPDNTFITKKELELMFNEILRKFNEFYPNKITKVVILQGYKNYEEAHPKIWKGIENNVLIEVWHKDAYETKEIKKEAINRFLCVLKRFPVGEEITCYTIAKELGYGKTEKEAWKNLWANRMNEYFPNYYFVCLYLKKIGIIDYSNKGKIKRKV